MGEGASNRAREEHRLSVVQKKHSKWLWWAQPFLFSSPFHSELLLTGILGFCSLEAKEITCFSLTYCLKGINHSRDFSNWNRQNLKRARAKFVLKKKKNPLTLKDQCFSISPLLFISFSRTSHCRNHSLFLVLSFNTNKWLSLNINYDLSIICLSSLFDFKFL